MGTPRRDLCHPSHLLGPLAGRTPQLRRPAPARLTRPVLVEDVRRIVADLLGQDVTRVDRQAYGHGSRTFAARTRERTVYVRTSFDPDCYRATAANLAGLAALGLPVPHVLSSDLSLRAYPFAYLVTDAFPGRDLGFEIGTMTRPQSSALAVLVASAQRTVAALAPGDGFGFGPLGAGGPHTTWPDVVRADRDTAATDTVLTQRTLAALDRAEQRLAQVDAVCFLDDLTTKNVIVSGGELSGFVDFDVVCFGDPMYWLALTQVAMLYDVGAPGQFYVDELRRQWGPTCLESADLALYSAVHACEFLSWGRHDDATAARLHAAAEQWLAETG